MLPPIRAVSLTEPVVTAPPPVVVKASAVADSATAPDDTALPVSGGRLGAMALSVQLQMAQGFSVFAETLGLLLNLPREPNESLASYAQRLATAVQALDPARQALLETALNQLADGTTLRLLADILKDPVGPEAAGLAASLDITRPNGSNSAISAAVSSYLHNEQALAPAAQPLAPPSPPASADRAAPASNAAVSTPPLSSSVAAAGVAAGATLPTSPSSGKDAAPVASPTPPATISPAAASPAVSDPEAPIALRVSTPPLGESPALSPATAVQPPLGEMQAAALHREFQEIRALAVAVADVLSRLPGPIFVPPPGVVAADEGVPAAPVTLAAGIPTEASSSSSPGHAENAPAPARGLGENVLLAMTAWLADAVSASALSASSKALPSAAAAKPGTDPANGLIEYLLAAHLAMSEAEAEAVARHPVDPATTASTARQAAAAENPQNEALHARSAADPKAALPAAADTAQAPPLPLPVFVPREGVPAAFVPYPPATEPKRDREGRRTKEVTKIDGEEEETPSGGQHGFQNHEQRRRSSGDDPDGGEPVSDEEQEQSEETRRAQDLYLKMAGWS